MADPPIVSFDARYLDWVLNGTKTRTTRYGESLALGPARFRFESDPPVFVAAVVTGLRTVPLGDLSDDDAAAENFAGAAELRAALAFHYHRLPDDATVKIAEFTVDRPER